MDSIANDSAGRSVIGTRTRVPLRSERRTHSRASPRADTTKPSRGIVVLPGVVEHFRDAARLHDHLDAGARP